LEAKSNLTLNDDFSVGYSPERINPGDKLRTVEMIDKLVSSSSAESLQVIHKLYSSVMLAPVHKISKIEIAEAAKVIENIQRDVNIALMNEFSHIFNKLGLSTNEILEAASTKWNFLDFKPGLVGGHCIGVDPYYLVHKAKEVDYFPELILTARRINESMVQLVTNEIVDKTRIFEKENKKIKILILGYTFKENVSDTRNSKIVEIVDMLLKNDFQVNIYDPNIVQEDFVVNIKTEHRELFLYEIQKEQYHCLVVGVNHNLFQGIYRQIEKNSLLPDGIIFDLPNVGKFTEVSFAL
jgi:UDP-N-acetyl-D-galactosamine dehydrogenase